MDIRGKVDETDPEEEIQDPFTEEAAKDAFENVKEEQIDIEENFIEETATFDDEEEILEIHEHDLKSFSAKVPKGPAQSPRVSNSSSVESIPIRKPIAKESSVEKVQYSINCMTKSQCPGIQSGKSQWQVSPLFLQTSQTLSQGPLWSHRGDTLQKTDPEKTWRFSLLSTLRQGFPDNHSTSASPGWHVSHGAKFYFVSFCTHGNIQVVASRFDLLNNGSPY